MSQVFSDKVFYHIYALGMGNCPKRNDFACPAGDFFEKLAGQLDGIRALGCNALLIGPVFESTAHGYDTVDYYHVERRLGNNERFKQFCPGAMKRALRWCWMRCLIIRGGTFLRLKIFSGMDTAAVTRIGMLILIFPGGVRKGTALTMKVGQAARVWSS